MTKEQKIKKLNDKVQNEKEKNDKLKAPRAKDTLEHDVLKQIRQILKLCLDLSFSNFEITKDAKKYFVSTKNTLERRVVKYFDDEHQKQKYVAKIFESSCDFQKLFKKKESFYNNFITFSDFYEDDDILFKNCESKLTAISQSSYFTVVKSFHQKCTVLNTMIDTFMNIKKNLKNNKYLPCDHSEFYAKYFELFNKNFEKKKILKKE